MKPEVSGKVLVFPAFQSRSCVQKSARHGGEHGNLGRGQAGDEFIASLRANVESARAIIRDCPVMDADDQHTAEAITADGSTVLAEVNTFNALIAPQAPPSFESQPDSLAERPHEASIRNLGERGTTPSFVGLRGIADAEALPEFLLLQPTSVDQQRHSSASTETPVQVLPVKGDEAPQPVTATVHPHAMAKIISLEGIISAMASRETGAATGRAELEKQLPGSVDRRRAGIVTDGLSGARKQDPNLKPEVEAANLQSVEGAKPKAASGSTATAWPAWQSGIQAGLQDAPGVAGSAAQQIAQNIAQAIGQRMPLSDSALVDMQKTIRFALQPENLGAIEVRMTLRAGKLDVSFMSEKESTAKLVLHSQEALRDALARHGLVLDALSASAPPLDQGTAVDTKSDSSRPAENGMAQTGQRGHAAGGNASEQERPRHVQEWRWKGSDEAAFGDWEDPHRRHVRDGVFL